MLHRNGKPIKAKEHYFNNEPMSVVAVNGQAKAYPLSILMFHEIVNDSLNGEFFSVTYCPLCNSSLVFNRSCTETLKNNNMEEKTN